jgi:hypothetical protein
MKMRRLNMSITPKLRRIQEISFFYSDLKAMLDIENDREFVRALIDIKGGIIEKVNNTIFERDMPECMLRFLERLLK